MPRYASKQEVLDHFHLKEGGLTPHPRPVNPKTGFPYGENSWKYWLWWWSISDADRSAIANCECNFH